MNVEIAKNDRKQATVKKTHFSIESYINGLSAKNKVFYILLFLLTFIVHFIVVCQLNSEKLSLDGFSVIAMAAFFSGRDWSSIVSIVPQYYGFIQALLYVPLFFITDNPDVLYVLMGTVNACLLSLIPCICFYISTKYFSLTRFNSLVISFIIGLFPNYLATTKFMWNETVMNFIPWIFILLIVKLLDGNKKALFSGLLGFLCMVSYAAHPRGIVFIIASVMLIIYVSFAYKRHLINYISFILTAVVTYMVTSFMQDYLMKNLWLVSENYGQVNNTLAQRIGRLNSLFTLEGIAGFFGMFFSELFASILSTFGLLLVFGFIFYKLIVVKIKNKKISETIEICSDEKSFGIKKYSDAIIVFLALSFLGTLAISAISFVSKSGDYYIYTRYVANIFAPIMFIAILYLIHNKSQSLTVLDKIFIALYLLFLPGSYTVHFNRPEDYYIIFSLAFDINSVLSMAIATALVFLFFSAIIKLIRGKKNIVFIMLIAVFLYSYVFCAINDILVSKTVIEVDLQPANTMIAQTSKFTGGKYYFNSKSAKDQIIMTQLQFDNINIDLQVPKLNQVSDFEKIEENSIIITPERFYFADDVKDLYRIVGYGSYYFYIYGKELHDVIENQGVYELTADTKTVFDVLITDDRTEDDTIVSDGTAGCLFYGPYETLQQGKYALKLSGKLIAADSESIARIDCTNVLNANSADEEMIEDFHISYFPPLETIVSPISISDFIDENGMINLEYEFYVDGSKPKIEYRLFTDEGTFIEIYDVSVELIETYDKASDEYSSFKSTITLDNFDLRDMTAGPAGEIFANSITSNGEDGYLFYGPYIDLEAGEYEIAIAGNASITENSAINIDIMADSGQTALLESTPINDCVEQSGDFSYTLKLNLETDSKGIEIRLFIQNLDDIKITDIQIRKVKP